MRFCFMLWLLICGQMTVACAQSPAEPKPGSGPPNIIIFMVDDLGYSDVGFNGGTDIQTPHIDALASRGAILNAHYVQPVCSPTRAALLTGRYATHTGVYTVVRPHARWGLPLQERTLASALQEVGYETCIAGKWHLGEFEARYRPTARGFQRQYGHYFGAIDYFTHERDSSHDWYRDDVELREDGYSTELIASECVRIIRERPAGPSTKPLFLSVPFNGVHSPLQVPESYLKPYGHLQGNRRTYAGMLSAVDTAIGRILQALQDQQQLDQSLILFSSDNGGPNPGVLTRNGRFRAGKGTLYEGGIRSAACVTWPGKIPAGVRKDAPVHIIDWFPTLLEVAGGSLAQPLPLDGRSLMPFLTLDQPTPHESLLLVQSPERAAIRAGDWKLLQLTESAAADAAPSGKRVGAAAKKGNRRQAPQPTGNSELYNLSSDPEERQNVANEHPDVVRRLKTQLDEYLKDAVPPGQPG